MDHLDWFSPGSKDVDDEVDQFYRVLSPGGFVLWRSAARKPWYCDVCVFYHVLGPVMADVAILSDLSAKVLP